MESSPPEPPLDVPSGSARAAAPARLDRRDLYDLVWTRPMTAVAGGLGLSRNGLAKICDRLLIPYPGRGYWSRARGALPADRPALPPAPVDAGETITVSGLRSGSRRPRRRLARVDRADQLIDAAAAIIVKEGLPAATMKRVAREAGLSEAQAHNYFSRQADLLIALARRELAVMNAVRQSEVERGRDSLTRVTLSTITYLRQVEQRGALIQILLNSPAVRAGLRPEREAQAASARGRLTERLTSVYGVPADRAYGATVILTAVCLRAGRMLAGRRVSLHLAEALSLAIVTAGNRAILSAARARAG